MDILDDDSMIAIQMTILGLTITEWMAKLREEFLTYDLVTAMAVDFFFAYDVIDFVMMLHHDEHILNTGWMLVFENKSSARAPFNSVLTQQILTLHLNDKAKLIILKLFTPRHL